MEAIEIIKYLRQRDLSVSLIDGDGLEVFPEEKITDQLIERLRKHKPEIVEELKREQNLQIELIRTWLTCIEEPPEDHCLMLDKCRNDPEAMEYFLKHVRNEFKSF